MIDQVILSGRMEMIARLLPVCRRVCDIGTDHGYLPIWLLQNGRAEEALACDVRRGPLERAAAHVREAGLSGKVDIRLSDGFEKIAPGEADGAIIAGMGGPLICRILGQGAETVKMLSHLVISPQSDIPGVRRWLWDNGLAIRDEDMICEEGKYYTAMLISPGAPEGTDREPGEIEFLYGAPLLRKKHPVLREALAKERLILETILAQLEEKKTDKTAARRQEVLHRLVCIREAEDEMQRDQGDM